MSDKQQKEYLAKMNNMDDTYQSTKYNLDVYLFESDLILSDIKRDNMGLYFLDYYGDPSTEGYTRVYLSEERFAKDGKQEEWELLSNLIK